MRRIKQILFFVLVLSLVACRNNNNADKAAVSAGNINEVSIIISDALWNGEVGDSIRKRLAAPIDGLTQEEPLFTLNQYHEKTFEGIIDKGRNLVIIEKGSKNNFELKRDRDCTPQNVFVITGKSIDDLLELLEMHSDEMIKTIRETEIAEYQRRTINGGIISEDSIRARFGITIKAPKAYNAAIQNSEFLWLKKDIPSGNASLLIYRVPVHVVEKDKTINSNIIKMRDSIGNMYIHGQEPGTYMKTEEAYSPYVFNTSFNEKRAVETRGNWEMESMNGPFINYAIKDEKNNCYLIVEGFIYSPSAAKRDLLVELESIIKSIKFL
jgi:hypothetical protein